MMHTKKTYTRICRVCGKEWRVAVTQATQQKYICPKCDWLLRHKMDGGARHGG